MTFKIQKYVIFILWLPLSKSKKVWWRNDWPPIYQCTYIYFLAFGLNLDNCNHATFCEFLIKTNVWRLRTKILWAVNKHLEVEAWGLYYVLQVHNIMADFSTRPKGQMWPSVICIFILSTFPFSRNIANKYVKSIKHEKSNFQSTDVMRRLQKFEEKKISRFFDVTK